jgi:threonine-phosphate decarboxylase
MHVHGGDIYHHIGVLDFSANINVYGMPKSVRQAAAKSLDACIHYPDVTMYSLREAVAKRENVDISWIICGNGAADLIYSLVHAIRPAHALVTAPAFAEYEQALLSVDCTVHSHMLEERQQFQVDEKILEQITDETDLVFLCNPNNPTGQLIEPELLSAIADRCEQTGTYLILDECFNDFLDEPERYSLKSTLAERKHLVILKAFTKMYAMAGLRLGYALCANEELYAKIETVRQPWSVSIPAQAAGVAAAGEMQYASWSQKQLSEAKKVLVKELEECGISVIGGAANYLFFKAQSDLGERLLQQNILIRNCSNYNGLKEGYFRVAVRTPKDNEVLVQAIRSIGKGD